MPSRWDEGGAAGGDGRGEQAVGDPDLVLDAGVGFDFGDQQLGEGFFAAEVSGRTCDRDCDDPGPDDLEPDRVLFDGGGDGFEQPDSRSCWSNSCGYWSSITPIP
ncbi:hypothetical protein AB0J55_00580 [Amycolatopsis sp. NPDC049688]|uniref:hypothetical protein n=1 Tax=Amycolatopsis sp. NPDC049688 TaxID=3154733 RepID=UPI00342C9F99